MGSNEPLVDDDRAIEGLPIRLVIALVVGVASLGIMMNMLGGIGSVTTTETTVEYDESVVDDGDEVDISVVTDEGEPVTGSTVIVSSGSAQLEEDVVHKETGDDDNTVTIDFGSYSSHDAEVDFNVNQNMGTLEVEIVPPSDGDFVDDRDNPEIRVQKT